MTAILKSARDLPVRSDSIGRSKYSVVYNKYKPHLTLSSD